MNGYKKISDWKANAEFRITNRWLLYSSRIALRVKSALEDKNITQTEFAKTMGVSDQYISKIIKGKENLTLEVIYKLSQGLGVELISFPEFKYSTPFKQNRNILTSVQFRANLQKTSTHAETTANLTEYSNVYITDEIMY